MNPTRRDLLKLGSTALAIGAGLLAPGSASPTVALLGRWQQELPRLPMIPGNQTITMTQGWHRFHPWLPQTATWGYGGQNCLGPTIEARSQVTQTLTFANQLGRHVLAKNIAPWVHGVRDSDATLPRSTVHLHGAVVKSQFDGHPEDVFFPGQSKAYEYPNPQEACHLWYHDHSLGMTRLDVYAGLAGNYLLRDNWDSGVGNALGLPSGDFEIPLMLQDRSIDEFTGELRYIPAVLPQATWFPGFFGDLSVVNGAAFPRLAVARGVYRFRVLNAANSRFYTLSRSDGGKFHVIGNDQGLLNAPVATTKFAMAPGERYDVLIDFSNVPAGSQVTLLNSALPPNAGWVFGNFTEVMRFDVGSSNGPFRSIPATLRGGPGQRSALPAAGSIAPRRVRNFSIRQVVDPMCGGVVPFVMRLNNLNYDDGQPEVIKAGVWEQWNVVNTTLDEHSFHVHLAHVRIMGRQSFSDALLELFNPPPFLRGYWAPSPDAYVTGLLEAPAAWEAGRKDTVIAAAQQVTRLLVYFPTQAETGVDPTLPFKNIEGQALSGYMAHCHMLEHEDCDMMRPLKVTS